MPFKKHFVILFGKHFVILFGIEIKICQYAVGLLIFTTAMLADQKYRGGGVKLDTSSVDNHQM